MDKNLIVITKRCSKCKREAKIRSTLIAEQLLYCGLCGGKYNIIKYSISTRSVLSCERDKYE